MPETFSLLNNSWTLWLLNHGFQTRYDQLLDEIYFVFECDEYERSRVTRSLCCSVTPREFSLQLEIKDRAKPNKPSYKRRLPPKGNSNVEKYVKSGFKSFGADFYFLLSEKRELTQRIRSYLEGVTSFGFDPWQKYNEEILRQLNSWK